MKEECWRRVSSGKYVDINNLQPDDLDIHDISVALNNISRFTGHHAVRKPLTVAQHSFLCYTLAKEFQPQETEFHLAALIHDFAEAYIGDVATPVKQAMNGKWQEFAKPIEDVVEQEFFGGVVSKELHHIVKLIDMTSLDIERRVMWGDNKDVKKCPYVPVRYGPTKVEDMFNMASQTNINLKYLWEEAYDLTL